MVGVNTDGEISGARVLFQQETPGLGAKITAIRHGEEKPWFTAQYVGKDIENEFKVTQDGGSIDAITGATISSRTVTRSINEGVDKLENSIGGNL
jgi:electron transport complex protein RnfG